MRNWKIAIFVYPILLFFLSFLWLVFAFRTNSYFSVDDFRVLNYFKTHSVLQMIPDFLIHGDMFHYRKIIGFVVFGLLFKSFGVNPYPYIIIMFIIQTLNTILLFFVLRNLTKNDFGSFVLAMIFNKFYLFYFSNMHEIVGAFFIILSILLFLKYPKKLYLSLLAYVFALLSKELTYSLPFFLLAISFIKRENIKRVIPFFVVLLLYAIYQSYFVFVLEDRSFISAYGVTLSLQNFGKMVIFYLNPALIFFLFLIGFLARNRKTILVLLVFFMTLSPVLFFGARREIYYIYIPSIYLMIYIGLCLPKLNIKSLFLYIVLIIAFGGRSVFPLVARQNFPNWQKVSIENVTSLVEKSLSELPQIKEISLDGINLERDAKLMLQEGVLDLFMGHFSNYYRFVYNQAENKIIAFRH